MLVAVHIESLLIWFASGANSLLIFFSVLPTDIPFWNLDLHHRCSVQRAGTCLRVHDNHCSSRSECSVYRLAKQKTEGSLRTARN